MLKMFLHGRVLATLALVAACAGLPPAGFAADMNKVIRQVFPAAETGFDPAAAHDLYSATVEQAIFETLLTYDYLARPAKLVPLTAEAMPVVTDNGKTYTLQPGVDMAKLAPWDKVTINTETKGSQNIVDKVTKTG